MAICIYCANEKSDSELTLEHVIPQFLGGASAPDQFKIRTVCKKCNNTLGLFVDASYAKSWWISNWLAMTAIQCFDSNHPQGIPLVCMGPTALQPPEMADDEVCELWLGPHGEEVYWIRPSDEQLYWYVGGNPVTSKTTNSRAYFSFNENSHKNQLMTWLTFKDAFKNKAVRKIMRTTVFGANPENIGFTKPDELDLQRISYFRSLGESGNADRKISLGMNVTFDHRFMAKLGLGVGYVLFGNSFLSTPYCKELRNGLWHHDDQQPTPEIKGSPTLGGEKDPLFLKFSGIENAVTLTLLPTPEGVALNLNIGAQHSASILCAEPALMTQSNWAEISEGKVIILFPHLRRCITMSLPQFVSHHLGHYRHDDLIAANNDSRRNLSGTQSGITA